MNNAMAAREATPEEWAENLLNPHAVDHMTVKSLAQNLAAAIERGRRQEREACYQLANDHALTIDERRVAETPYGRHMTEQQCIDVAASQRHVAQYVGSLIYDRNPKPPPGFRIEQ